MITIQKGTIKHLDQLAILFDAYRVFYRMPSAITAARQFLQERIERSESEIFIAMDGDQAVGFVQLYPLFSSTRMRRSWLLNDLFVQVSHRGKGISRQLIDQAKQLARETNSAGLSLETEKNNTIGNQLYPATDFVLDEDHNYYFWSAN